MRRPRPTAFRSTSLAGVALAAALGVQALAQFPPPPPPPAVGMAVPEAPPPPAAVAAAADEAPAAEQVDAAPAEGGERIPPQARDPFWPVGYAPRRVVATPRVERASAAVSKDPSPAPAIAATPDWEHARALLVVRGVVGGRGRKYLATVNDQVVEVGDDVSITVGPFTYRWRILRITPKAIETEQIDVGPARSGP